MLPFNLAYDLFCRGKNNKHGPNTADQLENLPKASVEGFLE